MGAETWGKCATACTVHVQTPVVCPNPRDAQHKRSSKKIVLKIYHRSTEAVSPLPVTGERTCGRWEDTARPSRVGLACGTATAALDRMAPKKLRQKSAHNNLSDPWVTLYRLRRDHAAVLATPGAITHMSLQLTKPVGRGGGMYVWWHFIFENTVFLEDGLFGKIKQAMACDCSSSLKSRIHTRKTQKVKNSKLKKKTPRVGAHPQTRRGKELLLRESHEYTPTKIEKRHNAHLPQHTPTIAQGSHTRKTKSPNNICTSIPYRRLGEQELKNT